MPTTSTLTVTQISGGQTGNFVLSVDATRLFVAGSDGVLRIYDTVTGTLTGSVNLGGSLSGIDISPDGSFILVTNTTTATVNGATVSQFHRIDTTTLAVQTHSIADGGGLWDVVITAANIALVSAGGANTYNPVYSFDFGSGAITLTSIGPYGGNIIASPDNSVVLSGDVGLSTIQYYAYDALGRYLSRNSYVNGVLGSASGVEALTTSGNLLAIVARSGGEPSLQLYDGNFTHLSSLTALHPQLSWISALTFNNDGSVLYALSDVSDTVFGIRMSDLSIVESFALPAGDYLPSVHGTEMVLTRDEGTFFISSTTGVLRIDRASVGSGTSGDDTYQGVLYRDEYTGLGGNDTVNGDRGNDRLDGGAGNDALNGGFGDDELIGGEGNDAIDGGAGNGDVAVFSGNRADYTIDTSVVGVITITGSGASAGDGADTLRRVEVARFADMSIQLGIDPNNPPQLGQPAMLDQSVPDAQLYSYQFPGTAFIELDANDPLTFRAELFDGTGLPAWLSFDPATRTFSGTPPISAIGSTFLVRVYAADRGTEISDTFALSIFMADGPDIVGTANAEFLEGTFRRENIIGLGGNDGIFGSGGADTIDGGSGSDAVNYFSSPTGVTVDLAAGTGLGGFAQGDFLISIEGVLGSPFEDVLLGNDGANSLNGANGINSLSGRAGNDRLWITTEGGGSNIDGGADSDTLVVAGQAYLGSLVSIEAIEFTNDSMLFLTGAQVASGLALNTALSGTGMLVIDMTPGINLVTTGFVFAGSGVAVGVNGTSGNDTITLGNTMNGVAAGDGQDNITGSNDADELHGEDGADTLTGGLGNDALDGGSNIDTAIVSGNRAGYTVTQTSTGVFSVVGPDGTDTLTGVEFLQFADQLLRLLPGAGTGVDFNSDPDTYMAAIRDFDGNNLGAGDGWLHIGAADIDGDGDTDHILVNRTIGRFAEVAAAPDGLVYFADHGWAGETRVVGIYIDPLVASGQVVAGGPFDSQTRFQNDLFIENINGVLGGADYDHDGLQEVYFKLTDGTAYLHAYMHADGNIRYANYQSQQQVIDFLTSEGWAPSTWASWFPSNAEPQPKVLPVMEPLSFELESADAMAFADHGLERWQAEMHAGPIYG